MKGGPVHENVLLDEMEKCLRKVGASVRRQVPTGPGRGPRYADLVAAAGAGRLVIEAEMSSQRVAEDLQKALDLGATWLWIVAPSPRVARSVRRRLQRIGAGENEPWLCVLTLGQAIERVRKYFPLFFIPKDEGKTNAENKDNRSTAEPTSPPPAL